MSIKLFILGRPGSGKSTAFRHIKKYLEQRYSDWSITRYNDYDILQEMLQRDKLFPPKKKRFEEKEPDGFDVVDFSVLDEVLRIIEKAVQANTYEKKEELVIIEFARQDYKQALSLFSDSFLRDAHFLFLDTGVKTCTQRVKDRVTSPPTPDNHFVSENILTGYYGRQVIPSVIKTRKGEHVDKNRTRLVPNRGSLDKFNRKVENFIDYIMMNRSSTVRFSANEQFKLRRTFRGLAHPYPIFFTFSRRKKAAHVKNQATKMLPHFPFKKQ